jgi:chitin disaccharide deacetylase
MWWTLAKTNSRQGKTGAFSNVFVNIAMPIRIVVNADDLGISEEVNEAIFRRMEERAITSATLLPNAPFTAEAIKRIHRFPECSFGVHLNLTEFKPMRAQSRVALSDILDEQGYFRGNAIRETKIDVRILGAIYREWCDQIENHICMCAQPSHLDAHHHVHTIPQILPVLALLRRRYKINRIRISRNLYAPQDLLKRGMLAKKRIYNLGLKAAGFRTTGIFTDLETFVRVCSVHPPRKHTVEVMTHPGSNAQSEESRLLDGNWLNGLGYEASLVCYNAL